MYLNSTKRKKDPEIPYERAYTDEEIDIMETEIYGISLSLDPFVRDKERLGRAYELVESIDDIEEAEYGTSHILLAKVSGVRPYQTKNGEMAFISFESDREEDFETTCFVGVYSITKQWLGVGKHVVIEVAKQEFNGKTSLVLNKVQSLG